jgi:hypothetical protein
VPHRALIVVATCAVGLALVGCSAPSDFAPARRTQDPVTPPALSTNVVYSADIPDTLWRAARGAVPVAGNYVLVDEAGGPPSLYTDDMSLTRVTRNVATLTVGISGPNPRNGTFVGAASTLALVRGYYSAPDTIPFRNATAHGLFLPVGVCASPRGWFAVDSVAYRFDAVTALDLRFEQRCGNTGAVQRGQIHWRP